MLPHILFQKLLITQVHINSDTDSSLTIADTDDLDQITEKIKSEHIEKLIIGENFNEFPIFEGLSLVKTIEIQSPNIREIKEDAFKDNKIIHKVILAQTVTHIGRRAFYNSTISEINLENIQNIEYEAFSYCMRLSTINIPRVTSISSYAFAKSTITSITFSSRITSIPSFVCCRCYNLTTVESEATSINEYAFFKCISLTKLTYSKDISDLAKYSLSYTSIGELYLGKYFSLHSTHAAFFEIPITKLTIGITGDYTIPWMQTLKIVEFTKDCTKILLRNLNIEEIIIPDDLEYTYTIDISNSIVSIFPPGLRCVNFVANMPNLESVDLSQCTMIGANSFFNCPKLKQIIGWGDHDMVVQPYLFELCPLIDIKIWTSHLKPDVIKAEYKDSILQCTSITEMTIKGLYKDNRLQVIFPFCTKLKKVVFEENCGLQEIQSYMFANCTSLSEITLPNSINVINAHAFTYTKIEIFDLKNVRLIYISAFVGIEIKELILHNNQVFHLENDNTGPPIMQSFIGHLEKITFSENMRRLPITFINNPYLKEVKFTATDSKYVVENNIVYDVGKRTLICYPGGLEAKEFVIPDHVLSIEVHAFIRTKYLEKIIVSENVLMSKFLFLDCPSVKTIEFKSNRITAFPDYCFSGCTSLINIIIPETSTIDSLGLYCFEKCSSLTTLTFKNELTIVMDGCFSGCTSLTDVDLSRIYSIPPKCFKGTSHVDLRLSDSLQIIDKEAFMDSKIHEFHCPANLYSINEMAFCNCTELLVFEFNDKIKSIGHLSFSNTGITELLIPNSLVSISHTSFVYSEIEFRFNDDGHPLYYIEGNCFMNKTRGLMFLIKNQRKYFEVPPTVKLIYGESFKYTMPYMVVVDPMKVDQNLVDGAHGYENICIKGQNYYGRIIDCKQIISDINNPDRYAKEGEYEPTYKIDPNIFDDNDTFIYDLETNYSILEEFFLHKFLSFVDDFDGFGTLHVVLISMLIVLSVIIVILSLVILNIS